MSLIKLFFINKIILKLIGPIFTKKNMFLNINESNSREIFIQRIKKTKKTAEGRRVYPKFTQEMMCLKKNRKKTKKFLGIDFRYLFTFFFLYRRHI